MTSIRIGQAATLDRVRALQPDYETPFNYPTDALQRLLCYHVFTANQVAADPKAEEEECASPRSLASRFRISP